MHVVNFAVACSRNDHVHADFFCTTLSLVSGGKANGKEIRNYVVQRFSSNMVFLSLLLGTDMSVLMNSSKITQEIRDALEFEQYYSLKFYVGAVMALASCVTVVGVSILS